VPITTIGCGFPTLANRGKLAGMSWHRTPTDDAWRQAHLAMVEGLGKRLWLGCDHCQHTVMIAPRELADRHGLDMQTPLLTLSRALRCTRCGERKGQARLEPHGYGSRR
jgi:DNA-directed RNA polymerase subunit RPC12/RpoP